MSTKALKKELLAAVVMLLVAAVALSGSTYAWFAVNTKVEATGMEVKTQVSSNLLISGSELASASKNAEDTFGTIYTASLADTLIEPVSTTTGKAFFYTVDAKADGSKNQSTADEPFVAYNAAEVPTSDELNAFNTTYGTTGAVGYVDYVFQLKATNSSTFVKPIKLTKLDLDYKQVGTETDDEKANRVAIFVTDAGEDGSGFAAGSGTLNGVYAPTGAVLHSSKTVNSTTTIEGNPTAGTGVVVAAVPAGKTNYYKVVVRVWLEGQDTTCTNETFMDLTKTGAKWSLDLELALDTDSVTNTAVSVINKTTTTP